MNRESAREKFSEYIKEKNLRYTKQREQILDAFFSFDRHFTIEELYAKLKKNDVDVGYATLYRTLKLIRECGLSGMIKLEDGKAKWEKTFGIEHHDHLICMECGRIIEVKSEKIEQLQNKLAAENRFTPVRHKLEIYGICAECQ